MVETLVVGSRGLVYYGTDITKSPSVDFVANFENDKDMAVFSHAPPFGTILVLNVLEHTFDPIRILDNAISLLKPGGKCAVLTPAIWSLHSYPMDVWRVQPNFYEEYAKRRGFYLDQRFFEYIGYGAVNDFRGEDGNYSYPPPCGNKTRYYWSRIIHKIFNTFGRLMQHPSYVAVGALIQKPLL